MPVPSSMADQLAALRRRLEHLEHEQADVTRERDRLIASAVRAGASLREVAALVGLSHMGVRDIVQRNERGE